MNFRLNTIQCVEFKIKEFLELKKILEISKKGLSESRKST